VQVLAIATKLWVINGI